MNRLGLIGKDISYSFSRGYFKTKFEAQNLPFTYENFDLKHITEFKQLFTKNHNIVGFNVTIPYKEDIIPYVDLDGKEAGTHTLTIMFDMPEGFMDENVSSSIAQVTVTISD